MRALASSTSREWPSGCRPSGRPPGGASEIIHDGENGFLVPPDNAEKLAEILATLARDRDLLVRMSVNALERYHQEPTWEETASQIREFLVTMIEYSRSLETQRLVKEND